MRRKIRVFFEGRNCFLDYRAGYRPTNILISGESAGAGLAVSLGISIRDLGLPRPAGLILLSPFVDCTLASESIREREGQDPIIDRDILTYMGTSYFQKHSPSDPLISPVYGNLSNLAPFLIQAAQSEVLVDDARRLASAAKDAGVITQLQLYPERLHIFSLFPFLESSAKAVSGIARFANECCEDRRGPLELDRQSEAQPI